MDTQPAPLGDVLRPAGLRGSIIQRYCTRLRFPFQILCAVTGKDGAEVFLSPRTCRVLHPEISRITVEVAKLLSSKDNGALCALESRMPLQNRRQAASEPFRHP
jgi:hypothetical protein